MTSLRRWAALAAVAVALLSAVGLALALTASPASAFSEWQHDGAVGCQSCHGQGTPTDASCTGCHPGFESYPDTTCWSCHYPGQDTTPFRTTSPTPTASPTGSPTPTPTETTSACSQECHLWNSVQKAYITPTTHGANPHLGSTSACVSCHPTSISVFDPGSSPHHSGEAGGFSSCGTCHASPQQHAGKVACTSCHATAEAFHLFEASSPGYTKCGSCHTMRHAGKKVVDEQVRAVSQGQLRPHRPALLVGHQEVRVQRLPHQETARQVREQEGDELPHLPQGQVPRRSAQRPPSRCAPLSPHRPAPRQRLPVHVVSPPRPSCPEAERRQSLNRTWTSASPDAASPSQPSPSPSWWCSSGSPSPARPRLASAAPARATCPTSTR